MSFFAVSIEKIATRKCHPNADRLDICTFVGSNFQFVTGREQFQAGDPVLYFPIDSVIPQPVLEKLNLVGKLAGSDRNRVKTIALRGEISQGIAAKPGNFLSPEQMELSPEEITQLLGVTKYEPEPNMVHDGILLPLPDGASVYDIEGADRFADAIELLLDRTVTITEKLEGSNFSITCSPEGNICVNMRNNTIIPIEGKDHSYWEVARRKGLIEKIQSIWNTIQSNPDLTPHHNQSISLYGEFIGPKMQGNLYQLKEQTIAFFDIRSNRGFLNAPVFKQICMDFDLPMVPILAENVRLRDWLAGRTLREASTGHSLLNPNVLREGVVIKPVEEDTWSRGRLILKQHSPEYLAKH